MSNPQGLYTCSRRRGSCVSIRGYCQVQKRKSLDEIYDNEGACQSFTNTSASHWMDFT